MSTQLQELTSGKFALDDGVEDFIFADVKDMKQHLDVLRETEEKCEKIIKLEKDWHDLKDEIKQQSALVGELEYIKRPLKNLKLIM